ncbi:MAG: cytochrome b/b6 domain-containing protein [Porphyrobacter sp.]|jgi:cytochrome b561|nr:cytochrome b/b6 domain-containing protein [Porphyrobacter sp.]
MASFYLVLALVLAATLNARARWVRVAGTLTAALGLFMMVYSIILADLDGTFAAVPSSAPLLQRITPVILNVQAVIAGVAVLFLLWSAWAQWRRPLPDALPLANTPQRYGIASRAFHWVMAVMMLCLVPIGLFMAVLPESAPERADFVSAHQSLGVTVLVLLGARIGWLLISPAPRSLTAKGPLDQGAAKAVHLGLYGAMLAFPLSGLLIAQGGSADFYGLAIALPVWPAASEIALLVHGWVLPLVFYATLTLHLAAVLKRHFTTRDKAAVRRMLR